MLEILMLEIPMLEIPMLKIANTPPKKLIWILLTMYKEYTHLIEKSREKSPIFYNILRDRASEHCQCFSVPFPLYSQHHRSLVQVMTRSMHTSSVIILFTKHSVFCLIFQRALSSNSRALPALSSTRLMLPL